jgi:hypothetical protein
MNKQLKVNDVVISVANTYPYRYDYGKGKQVLRIEIKEEECTFEKIKEVLKNCTSTIQYYESETDKDFTLKNEYENYSQEFNCQYENGIYSVEITRLSDTEQDIKALSSAVGDLALAIGGAK